VLPHSIKHLSLRYVHRQDLVEFEGPLRFGIINILPILGDGVGLDVPPQTLASALVFSDVVEFRRLLRRAHPQEHGDALGLALGGRVILLLAGHRRSWWVLHGCPLAATAELRGPYDSPCDTRRARRVFRRSVGRWVCVKAACFGPAGA